MDSLIAMKVIIGSNGFLGGVIQEKLRIYGENVECLSFRPSKKTEFIEKLTNILKDYPSCIINCGASQVIGDDLLEIEDLTNSNIFLPAAIASLIKKISPETMLVNFGTSWQIDENGAGNPFNAYAASKNAGEAMLDHYALDGVKIVTLRLFDTYGAGDIRKKVVNLIADALISKDQIKMTGGMQSMDLVHVEDVFAAVLRSIEYLSETSEICHHKYFVRSFEILTIKDLIVLMSDVFGGSNLQNFELGSIPYRDRERFVLCKETPTVPNWRAEVDLRDGLKELLEWKKSLLFKKL
jgi:CDP-3, 6-dideoxy-D-glycero-L-glycero-4-hexulose-4-reductase